MYKVDTTFRVASFSQQDEEETSIIGPDRTGSYLSISSAVAAVLTLFKDGSTFAQVCDRFCSTSEDVEALQGALSVLEEKGLISQTTEPPPAPAQQKDEVGSETSFVSRLARFTFSRVALFAYLILILLGVLAASADHRIVPGPSSMVFTSHRSGWILFVLFVNLVAVCMHEAAHFLAAQSVGVTARFGIGHRLWILVAETDLSGIWIVARSRRYVPLLAGCICDACCMSLLLCILYLNRHGSLLLGKESLQVFSAITFTYFTRLLWQCFFFVRTDLYYVFVTAFHCTNLMANTILYLKNFYRKLTGSASETDLDIPAGELSVVRVYAWFWLLGQAVALWAFFFISVPITLKYIQAGGSVLQNPAGAGVANLVDTLVSYVMILFPWFAGVYMWVRQLAQRKLWLAQSS